MNAEEQLHENIKKVLGLPDEPVAQTASGMMMLQEDPLTNVRREAELFLNAMCGGKWRGGFTDKDTVWLMVAFTRHLWVRQDLMRKAFDAAQDFKAMTTPIIFALDEKESRLIKTIVAEAIGSQDVQFDKPTIEAVKKLRDAFKRLQRDRNCFVGGKFGR